ncbi:MAG: TolC family protein [Mangrovibacterium sp.]
MFRKISILTTCVLLWGSAHSQQVITLDKAMQIAEEKSPTLQSTLLSLERSQQMLKAQKASMKSQFLMTLDPVSYGQNRSFDEYASTWYTSENFQTSGTFRIDQPILPTNGTISLVNQFGWQINNSSASSLHENKSFSNNLYLSLNQPLFSYNSLKQQLKTLELDLENTNLSYAMQRLSLERDVTQYFYNVYMAQMSLSIAKDELANTERSFEISKNKVEAGLLAGEELLQAELNYIESKSSVQNAIVTLENAKDAFKQYIGMDIYEEITVMASLDVTPVEVDVKQATQYALSSRMELRQREIDIQNSLFDLISTKATNEFKGDLNLAIGLVGQDAKLSDIYANPTRNPNVSLSFNVPIFDWGERKARIRAQETVIETQKLNYESEKTQIIVDIRSTVRNLQNQLIQIEISEKSEKNAQLTYEINLERYGNGDLTGMDLSQFQTQLSNAKKSSAQSLIDYKIQLLNLKIQTLYDFVNQTPIVPDDIMEEGLKLVE